MDGLCCDGLGSCGVQYVIRGKMMLAWSRMVFMGLSLVWY